MPPPNDPTFIDKMGDRLKWFNQCAAKLDQERKEKGGIRRDDLWRRRYYAHPYMLGSSNEVVQQRFSDLFINLMDLNENSQLAPRHEIPADHALWEKWTHSLEESGNRGCVTTADTQALGDHFQTYWKNGDPTGLQHLKRYNRPDGPILVKYSKAEFLRDMLLHGRVRVSPASEYNAQIHNYAVRDSELERSMIVPTFKERLGGKTGITFQGRWINFGTGDLEVRSLTPDYYVYCLSSSIFYRLPTDFEADAALIIRDPKRFVFALKQAFRSTRKGYQSKSGTVDYYDPYSDYQLVATAPQMVKHLRYSYQREYRITFMPQHKNVSPDFPIFLNIGAMTDYADLLLF